MSHSALRKLEIVGVEDGSFTRDSQRTLLVAVLMQGGTWIKDVQIQEIIVDGLDATEKLLSLLSEWTFDIVMLAGVSYAGFNLIDPVKVNKKTDRPVIIVTRNRPDNLAVKAALLAHFDDWETRWEVFEKLGPIYEVTVSPNEPKLYMETVGVNANCAEEIVRASSVSCRVPEPIRVARLIARGLTAVLH